MKEIVVIGAGKIGGAIALMLAETGDYKVVVTDRDEGQLAKVDQHPSIAVATVDIADGKALVDVLSGKFAVLSAAPFNLTGKVAEAALEAGVHYLDLTEDVATTKKVEELAENASTAFIPQCGLAPGFISIVANDLAKRFDSLDSVRMRVGALPQYPSNALNYNLTWSTDGLINEYIEPCEAVVEGKLVTVPAMEEREEFSLDGVTYEAFNTSGGLGTLAKSLEGRVRTMNYRTIRYPGHQAIIKALLNDLNLKNRRDVLKDLFENALPATMQDVVVIFVTVCGWKDGRYLQETYANKVYASVVAGKKMSAIQITTAAGITTVLDLLANGKLPQKGFVRQEGISLGEFLNNRFGQVYNPEAVRLKDAG
ncbi:saccharopine dehydrogenase family protein (plasmid) [Agrobacterium fabrum]|uniref:saccharopine dehydrogenase family protein n=1 Tax=Rhizobium/Agrobacterium group TaxID=227290 RepID=UPI0004D9EFC0|nr:MULTISPECIES: saccharopine dehydrogenase family protein [Rhizobium/Agrobacterium group]KEA04421.1 saccharopine dehydrogenase [Rhizobium rhizogenes]NMV72541.1 saccharopine dehydrogenase family protein [Agrobacterium fabrum]NTI85394.1 saccharopine dehydrogenase family protein [Rhizobium rhizogenes]NTJ27577.1 saccharopine dehydrogenase family protein [Rhizobium rhizogenes]QRM41766.1 saccharopine dehydrogenase family protein [Rhizobium rhizogenes]